MTHEADTTSDSKGQSPSASTERADDIEFFLPVNGFVWFYKEEVKIINHPAFQRLAKINQLGQAHLVFRGACHKRIEHVLGAVGVMQKIICSLDYNHAKSISRGISTGAKLSRSERMFVRLGALLHDIGHLAAGHTLEDELEIIDKHDADTRLDLILSKSNWGGGGFEVSTLREIIDREYVNYIPKDLGAISASDIVRLLIRKKPDGEDWYERQQEQLAKSSSIRLDVCSNMIGNTICADLLDYIYRDWYHVGRPRPNETRIFQYMEIRRGEATEAPKAQDGSLIADAADRFVISLGEKTKIRTDGVSAILGLLEWRYELSETVLFHRVKLSAGAMLDRALSDLWEDSRENLVEIILPLSDDQLIDDAIARASEATADGKVVKERASAALSLLEKLRDRVLFKELITFDSTNMPESQINVVKNVYSGFGNIERSGARNRASCARLIEKDFALPPGSIAIYCSQIKPKIAEVQIYVDGQIEKFSEFEKFSKNRLSGGHLEAQINRFDRLWRIHFFIDRDVVGGLSFSRKLIIEQTVQDVILSSDSVEGLRQKASEKALAYMQQENGNQETWRFLGEAERNDAKIERYPNGAPSIKSFLRLIREHN